MWYVTDKDTSARMGAGCKEAAGIDSLPDKVLLRIFSFLKHNEMMKYSIVNKKWRMIAQDSRLWGMVSLRPEISGNITELFLFWYLCHPTYIQPTYHFTLSQAINTILNTFYVHNKENDCDMIRPLYPQHWHAAEADPEQIHHQPEIPGVTMWPDHQRGVAGTRQQMS